MRGICLGTRVAHFTHHSLRVTLQIVFSIRANLRLAQQTLALIFCSSTTHKIPPVVNGSSMNAEKISYELTMRRILSMVKFYGKESLYYAFFHCLQYAICILTYRQMAQKNCFISQDEHIISLPKWKTNSLPLTLLFAETLSPRPSAQMTVQRINCE